MTSLVGYTGFVGSNIYKSAGGRIKGLYNSKNIEDAYDTTPDLLIYAGVRLWDNVQRPFEEVNGRLGQSSGCPFC